MTLGEFRKRTKRVSDECIIYVDMDHANNPIDVECILIDTDEQSLQLIIDAEIYPIN